MKSCRLALLERAIAMVAHILRRTRDNDERLTHLPTTLENRYPVDAAEGYNPPRVRLPAANTLETSVFRHREE